MNPVTPAALSPQAVQWIAVTADAVIATVYFALPAALVYFARRRPDLTLRPMFWLFGTFIVVSGLTYVMDIITTFWPEYGIDNAVKVVTACIGVSTAIAVWPIMPRALALPSSRSLEEVNAFLRDENARRRDAERGANEARASLEHRVAARTAELAQSNVKLEQEIQDRLRTEQALRYSETLLRRLHDELEDHITERTEELTRTIDELQAFTYTISHDLRAPLRAINGFAAIMREEEADRLSTDGRSLLEKIERNAARMGRLIDGLLEFSRLARAESSIDEVDMAALARSAAAEIAEEYGPQAPEVAIDALPVVKGDAAMLRQTWINLLSNAFKFSSREAAPRVTVSATEGDNEVTYHVKDNGVGFDMAYAGNLFGVFSRLHSSENYPGVGVGLAIVRRIVERHGGRVRAESWPGEGTTFHFTLPKAAAAPPLRALS
ncbi:MAG TPA: ATP-binding protein [Casimicrobiaceae bacterium]|nr:ATP-binding protein [Casimicrobiaceae bacterium]